MIAQELPTRTDILVVGGGIAGTSAAFHLARLGVEVTLVERDRIGEGATAAAAGILSPPLRQPFHETVHDRGAEAASAMWEFALRSLDGLSDLLHARGDADEVELDRSGGYVLSEGYTDHLVLGAFRALHDAGFPVRWLSGGEIRELLGGRGFTGGYVIEGGGALDPSSTAKALGRAAQASGARVLEGATVTSVEASDGGFACKATVTEDGVEAEVEAKAVVYAAHVEGQDFLGDLGGLVTPVRGQAFATEPVIPRFKGSFSTDWKTNVWRQRPSGRIVASGWRHDAWDRSYGQGPGMDEQLQGDIRRWFETAFPDLAPLPIEKQWSGVFGWTADYLPLVGPLPGRSGEWVVSGFSGGGLPFAFEAGRALAHSLAGGETVPGGHLLDPGRFSR